MADLNLECSTCLRAKTAEFSQEFDVVQHSTWNSLSTSVSLTTNQHFIGANLMCFSRPHLSLFIALLATLFLSAAFSNASDAQQKKNNARIIITDLPRKKDRDKNKQEKKKKNPFDAKFSMDSLKKICEIGPRISGTEGMAKQQALLIKHFEKLGAKIKKQSFQTKHPLNNSRMVTLTNLIVQFHPDKRKRILICTHYDTRPRPDRDPKNPNGVFLGANDGASGCALLMELGKHIKNLGGNYGIDFVFFDGEEFVYQRPRDPLFRGSTFFAKDYAKQRDAEKANPNVKSSEPIYVCGILLDMIGDKHLDLYWEKNSYKYAENITRSIWTTAQELKIKEFVPKIRHEIRDDHLPLNTYARIPTTDIIDFDYPTIRKKNAYWHTRMDTPDKCSGESMAKVGWVLIEWLKLVQRPREKK